jgi:4-hydroxy-3-methylbut-2-enyl diphosphate reductase
MSGIRSGPAIVLVRPRGFCAGVERAVEIVELALQLSDTPVFVRHHIVHNRRVVEALAARGARFVDDLREIPSGGLVIFSAHGVSPAVRRDAQRRGLRIIDATCPLVAKVHAEALRFARAGCDILLVGHRGHAEVVGTIGHAPVHIQVVETLPDAERVRVRDPRRVAVLTQTTISVDDAAAIIAALRRRFPALREPRRADVCYATQNRQAAIKALAARVDLVLVAGDATSSNSARMVEVARDRGVRAELIADAAEIRPEWLADCAAVGVSAAAAAPEIRVEEIVARLGTLGAGPLEEVAGAAESEWFALPAQLREVLPRRRPSAREQSPAGAAPGTAA